MKIMHIIPSFTSGGAERVVLNYMKEWQIFNHDNVMALALYNNKGSIFDSEISKLKLNVVYGNCGYNNKIEIIKVIRKYIKVFKPDVIHSHMRILPYVCVANIGYNINIVHTIHTDPEVSSKGKMRIFDKFCFKYLNVIPICLNKELANKANKLYDISKCEFLYNGIDINKYSGMSKQDKIKLRKSIGIPEEAFLVGHIGRFVEIKNHKLIVETFARLHNEKNNSYLILIGDGNEKNNIQEKVNQLGLKEYVIFLGTRSDVNELLQIMDVFIFPSKVEGLGIAFIEAQAANVLCVISNIIPEEAVVSNKVIRLNLDDDQNLWKDALVGIGERCKANHELKDFDSKYINKKLRNIYERCNK